MIKRTFVCKSKELILQLYKSLIRPKLEYCIQAWRPYLKNINILERVQKMATKMMVFPNLSMKQDFKNWN